MTAKVFTRIIGNRLIRLVVEQEKWIGEEQNGFKPGKSTVDNLLMLTSIMEIAKKEKRELHMVFVDLRKAYAKVNKEKLWRSLSKLKLEEESIQLIKKHL